ncbi:hypothetical protein K469DRAFT_693936 [Zopfia rhizophila CBS 207.26]|uniref:Uncharacterized protein n=1 Tax=Zopfia rhizophila CBS 207.26 TaxID=1314779 RepID=A0A6A6DJB2_9PEZI|nr:hypothetical protein K469DRAFT_693936 [Zopfia rhizophila CBS 207.26]
MVMHSPVIAFFAAILFHQSTSLLSAGVSAMEPTPITQLLTSWTDLSVEVDVEDFGAPAGSAKVVKWFLGEVKQRFDEPNDPLQPFVLVYPRLEILLWHLRSIKSATTQQSSYNTTARNLSS